MYAFLWNALPGGKIAKLLQSLLLIAASVFALFAWVFPWAAEMTELNDSATMDSSTSVPAESTREEEQVS